MTRINELAKTLDALGHPLRLRILSVLASKEMYLSEIAHNVGVSRALAKVHLKKLERAGLVKSRVELVEGEAKALRYYKLQEFDDEPAYAVDILAVELSQVQTVQDSKNLTECRCTDGTRIWKIVTNIQDLKTGIKLACAILPPVEMMGIVSEAMFLGGEPLPEETELGFIKTPPSLALDQARAQVLQITKRMT